MKRGGEGRIPFPRWGGGTRRGERLLCLWDGEALLEAGLDSGEMTKEGLAASALVWFGMAIEEGKAGLSGWLCEGMGGNSSEPNLKFKFRGVLPWAVQDADGKDCCRWQLLLTESTTLL